MWEKLRKVGKMGNSGEKLGKSGEKVAKSGEK